MAPAPVILTHQPLVTEHAEETPAAPYSLSEWCTSFPTSGLAYNACSRASSARSVRNDRHPMIRRANASITNPTYATQPRWPRTSDPRHTTR